MLLVFNYPIHITTTIFFQQGKEVAKEAEIEMIQPGKELLVGQQLGEFNKRPNEEELSMAGVAPNAHLETKQGKVLDQDIESGR